MKRLLKITKVLRDPISKRMIGQDITVFEDGDIIAKSSEGIYHEIPIVSVVEKMAPSMRELSAAEELEAAEDCYARPDLIEALRAKVSETTLLDLDQDA